MLSTKDIETQLRGYRITPLKVYVEECEYHMKLPYFMVAFNKFVAQNNRIPSQEEFVDFYFKLNKPALDALHLNSEKRTGVKARCIRSYPSLIRDLHFTSLLMECGLNVKYDLDTDVNKGVDQTIIYDGKTFFVHCFVQTSDSIRNRGLKDMRHKFGNYNIDLPLDLDSREVCRIGDFKLYSKAYVERLISLMKNYRVGA